MKTFRIIVFTAFLLLATAAHALNGDCLRFTVVGICVWITCVGPVCEEDTSIKYGHFNPDLAVAVLNPEGVDRAEDGHRTDSHARNHQNMMYRDVIALGHPAAGQIYCPSQAEALEPYFVSDEDTLGWRWAIPDIVFPASYIIGVREIGDWPFNTWGAVFPRTGWTIQSEEPKTAAIVAQRAGDIVTRSGEPHVYQALEGKVIDGVKFTWEPEYGLTENTNRGGDWELHLEDQEEEDSGDSSESSANSLPSCEVFGANDVLSGSGWGGGKVESGGDYLFTLWRPYTCCEIEGEALLFYVDFIQYPLESDD